MSNCVAFIEKYELTFFEDIKKNQVWYSSPFETNIAL